MAEDQHGSGTIVTGHVLDTEYTAVSAEFCPCEQFTDLLLCGTYQLIEPEASSKSQDDCLEAVCDLPKKRVGRVYVFSVQSNTGDKITCTELERIETSAVLDIKWNSVLTDDGPVFTVADSDGKVTLYNISRGDVKGDGEVKMVCDTSIAEDEEQVLALSLDWSTIVNKSSPTRLMCSDSAGRLSLLSCDEGGLTILSQWKAHDFEAWITAFNAWDTNVIYSGGDDCRLKGWDLRSVDRPVVVSKRHEMGVVSIQSNPLKEHILATGSYDEHLLIWDTRQMKTPLSDTPLGGGLFRVKWHPGHGGRILTASMHNGFHILDAGTIPNDGRSLAVIGHYKEGDHGSLAYGADWSRDEINTISPDTQRAIYKDTIATCSFYDHSLHIWNFKC